MNSWQAEKTKPQVSFSLYTSYQRWSTALLNVSPDELRSEKAKARLNSIPESLRPDFPIDADTHPCYAKYSAVASNDEFWDITYELVYRLQMHKCTPRY